MKYKFDLILGLSLAVVFEAVYFIYTSRMGLIISQLIMLIPDNERIVSGIGNPNIVVIFILLVIGISLGRIIGFILRKSNAYPVN